MSRIRSFRPSPAIVVACLALLVALAGTGLAAVPNGQRALAPDVGDTYSTYHDDAIRVTSTSTSYKTLATLNIPQKGNYTVLAKAYFGKSSSFKEQSGIVHCTLAAGSSEDETVLAMGNQEDGTLALHLVTALTAPAKAKLQCRALADSLTAMFTKITATRVRRLTILPA